MNKKNINLTCYNKYCAFNENNKCIRTETSLNRIGVCENMFLINADKIEHLQEVKNNYLKNILEPTDEIMQNDVNWFNKQIEAKETHPLELLFDELEKQKVKEKRTKN